MELFVRAKVSYSTLYLHERIACQLDSAKTEHLEYPVGVPAHLHKIAFRPASNATMAEDTSQSEGTAHKGGDVRRPRFNSLEYPEKTRS